MLERFDRALGKFEITFCIACMAMVVMSTALGVCFRYILNSPLLWANDAGALALVWLTFVGAAAIFKEDGHVAISGLVGMCPPRWRLLAALASAVIVGLCVAIIGWYAVLAARVQWPQEIVALNISRGFYSVPIVWAAMSMSLSALLAASKAVHELVADVEAPGKS